MTGKTSRIPAQNDAGVDVSVIESEDLVSTAPSDWVWEMVEEESPSRVIFDAIGDIFIGQFKSKIHIDQEPDPKGKDMSFDLWTFRGRDGALYAINDSYKMTIAMEKVKLDDWCRITYIKDIPTNKGNPVKDLRVERKSN